MAMAIKHIPEPGTAHTHQCCICSHIFLCEYTADECTSKGVRKAVDTNKDGPYCMLCYHAVMMVRVAMHRKLKQHYLTR